MLKKLKKSKSSSDEEGEGDSESEDGNDFVDDEHLVDEVEVNMSSFKFQIDGEDDTEFIDHIQPNVNVTEDETKFIDPIQPNVNVTEDDLEVLDFDSLESDQDDENARSRGLRMLRKKHKSSRISNNFYVGKEFPNRELAKERIRAYAVETRRNLDFKRNDKRRIRVICNGVVTTLNSMNEYVDKRCNPDSTFKIDVYGENDPEKTTRMFRRIYVCLGALKMGFKEGGRELLGLDGAFMRGQYHGQMLTAMGVDANNGIYPVAYGIVESENEYSWTWFLKCLADDFDLFSNSNFTFITNRQNGLLPTIAKLFPSAEHRFCMRHINKNMNLTWKGGDYKEMLWRAVGETFDIDVYDTYTNSSQSRCIMLEGYEDDDDLVLHYKIPLKSLDIGLKPLDSVSDISNFLSYVNKHKMMYVYVEKVKKSKSSSDEEGEGDSESEDGNDFVDDEHLVDEVEVNMSSFKFQIDGEDDTEFIDHIQPNVNVTKDDTKFIDPIQPNVNVTEDDLEVLDFDSLKSDQDDENARSRGLRMLRKKYKSSRISNNFYVGKEFPNRDLAKERIRAYAVETRRNLDFKRNDKRRIRVICNGVVTTLNSMNEYVDKRCNPDSTVKIDAYGEEDPEKTTRMFRRIYVCLGALKMGFKECGRELLGLDDAFMRGQYPGQMLTAMGVDANNGIYPVAYGIVESENEYSWTWFLKCLANDFDLFSNSNFTFITDRQNGLLPTIAKLFPSVEHRFCVRHINKNMNLTWKGGDYKEMLWRCATSKTIVKFEKYMDELKNYNKKDHEWLGIPCKHAIAAIHDMADNGMGVGTPEDWKRKGEIAIVKGGKLTRKGKTVTCSNCKGIGHNKRGCKATGLSDRGQRHHMPSDMVPSQPLGSQQVASQGMSTQPLSSQAGPSEPVARKRFTKSLWQENLLQEKEMQVK
nr:hypothetical protein [Tanacetum cinerariifolium]